MFSPRTAKVLGSLLIAMTVGALLLMVMESEPPRPGQGDLAAAGGMLPDRSLQATRPWKRVVVHSSCGDMDTLPQRCHFIVRSCPDANGHWVRATDLWDRQIPGQHIYVPGEDYNADTIGVCVIGDFETNSPEAGQFEALVSLVCQIQHTCRIPADSVYLRRQLHGQPKLPGDAFPVGTFEKSLARILD